MIKDTHRLRRSIVALLNKTPNKSLSYENIRTSFFRSSAGEVRTNATGLVLRGFATRQGDIFTLTEGGEPTNSAKLYAKLNTDVTYTASEIQEISKTERGVTSSAIESLLKDGGLKRVGHGVYICQDLPPIYPSIQPNQNIVSVCPVRRTIWDDLTSDITDYETFAERVSETYYGCSRRRVGYALSAMSSVGSILVSEGLILKGDSYKPLPDDVVYAHIKSFNEVTLSEIKNVCVNEPCNAVKTLTRLGALERISKGRYRVNPLPQHQETEAVEIATGSVSPTETQKTEVDESATWQKVAKALASVDSAKRIYEALQGEAKLKMQEVGRLRNEANTLKHRADQIEASYAQPLADAEHKTMEAREELKNLLKQNELI